jgi:hypothetical protein
MSADRLTRAVLERLVALGQPWPALAAAVLVTRGVLELDRADFAAALGVDEPTVRELETGERPPVRAPPTLADVAPHVAWHELGVPLTRPLRCGSDRRHPSAHRPARLVR